MVINIHTHCCDINSRNQTTLRSLHFIYLKHNTETDPADSVLAGLFPSGL